MYRVEAGICQKQGVGVCQADILRCENNQSTGYKSWLLTTCQHSCQVVYRRIRVAASHALDKGRDNIVVLLAILVVEGDILLQHIRDKLVCYSHLALGRGEYDIEDVEQLSRITTRKAEQRLALGNLLDAALDLRVGREGTLEQLLQILLLHRAQGIDLTTAQEWRDDLE